MNDSANHIRAEPNVTAELPACSMNDRRAPSSPIQHLYIHIPFCARICPYCAFYKELLDPAQTGRLGEAILCELEQDAANFELDARTIFWGGGTPTALTMAQLKTLLEGFKRHIDWSRVQECTMEANPGSVSARKAEALVAHGISRLSLGVQSWNDQELKLLGREHNARQAEESFRLLRGAGFSNINIDLMFGLPSQTIDEWKATLQKTIDLGPEHVSAYCLTYEEDTEFFLRHSRGELRSNADVEADLLETAMSMFEAAGYEQYEISNYAKPGYASAHNRGYWAGHDYLGLGPSAFSTVGLERWQNVCDYREYIDRLMKKRSAVASTEQLTPEMKRTERIALSLRAREGIPIGWTSGQHEKVREFVNLGLLQQAKGNLQLTRAGRAVADTVAEALI